MDTLIKVDTHKLARFSVLNLFLLPTFFLTAIVINILQCIAFFTLRYIHTYFYKRVNFYLSYMVYAQFVYITDWHSNSEICLHIDKNDLKYLGKEHSLFTMNHSYEIDWLFIGSICDKLNPRGDFKAYMKKIIQFIPGIGWCLYFQENVFLQRNFEKDKEIIRKQINNIVSHPIGSWMVFFPEGTRFTEVKHKQSLLFAKQKGLPELKHHLNPKPRGFMVSLESMRGKNAAVYDVTFSVNPTDEINPTMMNVLLGYKMNVHVFIKRIPLEQIPSEELEVKEFLNNMFIEKDKRQDNFYRTGEYYPKPESEKYEKLKLKRQWLVVAIIFIWGIIVNTPIWFYLLRTFFFAQMQNKALVLASIASFLIFANKILAMNSFDKGRK